MLSLSESSSNLLRSLFISIYLSIATMISVYASWHILQGKLNLGWVGVLLTSLPIVIVIAMLMILKKQARTSMNLPWLNLLAWVGLGMTLVEYMTNSADVQIISLSIMGVVGILLYVHWYSTFGGRKSSNKLIMQTPLPHFELKGLTGETVTTKDFIGKPTIFMFYRGNWCPLCMAQIKEISAQYKEIETIGARVVLISLQPHTNTISLAQKHSVNFDFMTDEGNKAGKALGIDAPNGLPSGMQLLGYDSDTVLPTVIITDAHGKIIWKHETDNYRIRPEPDTYLNVLRGEKVALQNNLTSLVDLKSMVMINGKAVSIEWSKTAARELTKRSQPLIVEIELYFSCMVKKLVNFHESANGKELIHVNEKLSLIFRPVTSTACTLEEGDALGRQPEVDLDSKISKKFTPRHIKIDFTYGKWQGKFWV